MHHLFYGLFPIYHFSFFFDFTFPNSENTDLPYWVSPRSVAKDLKLNPIPYKMSKAQDPFYIVKEEIQDSVDELAKAISVAARDPSWYGINEVELENRRRWTSNARLQVADVKRTIGAGKENDNSASVIRRELMRLPNSQQPDISDHYSAKNNDDFVASESDRQMLLLKQQDEELDELSTSVKRIGGVGLTIHEELLAQEKILDELGTEMDSTKNRLDFVQKKMGMVMKKAGAKGQIMIIIFLLVLFIILFILVFFT
ncbi:syntaxin-61-like isoform X2 [Gossypium arboreum]|uniref:syntaxin-61-like isoform X2 n=1 Tax=Gossypium arboreum TaxID=29729 RepID=UPI0022F1A058|nr:syntaxin-61-like isoform X2 [Gossypium arboreum]